MQFQGDYLKRYNIFCFIRIACESSTDFYLPKVKYSQVNKQ
jgi:hypothetical protein